MVKFKKNIVTPEQAERLYETIKYFVGITSILKTGTVFDRNWFKTY